MCRKAFLILHTVKNKAVFRLSCLVVKGKSPHDNRGKHCSRGNGLPVEAVNKIDQHILSFLSKESHYSSMLVKYLSADLNVQKMHDLSCEQYPDLRDVVKYDYYRKHFREYYDFRFGRPQVDVCLQCELLTSKIKSQGLNDTTKRVAAAEKMVHLRRAKKFYSKQKEIRVV